MEIIINNIKDYSKKEETIIIKDDGIYYMEGKSCYEKLLNNDYGFISEISSDLCKLMFSWKEEYIGPRMIDGERYHIVVDVCHKKKKYKIQNKFPSNWEEFLVLKEKMLEGNLYD